ncbi:MAG TPA: DUF1349 domain-containing protein [Verrucomicrobiae bacterium]|nr:DUF1349 domain-containing protein [Verrucomicrobiae bacterium]
MPNCLVHETFQETRLHSRLQWLNPPPVWRIDPTLPALVVEPQAETDFWQRTHYGFQADNGHLLYAEILGNTTITAKIHSYPVHQYDQAGLMVRFSPECWLKSSVEFETNAPSQLGAVVTNGGYSDWSLQDFPYGPGLSCCLRIQRDGGDFLAEHAVSENGPWFLMRVAHLFAEAEQPALAGFYACSPKGPGSRAALEWLKIEPH